MYTESTVLLIVLVALAAGYLIGIAFPLPRFPEERQP